MINAKKKKLWEWIWKESEEEKSAWDRLKPLFRIFCILGIEFKKDGIPLRSSALTFTVILSMVPVLALGTAVLKGLGAGDQMKKAAYAFIERLEVTEGGGREDSGEGGVSQVTTMTAHLRRAVDTVFDYVDRTNFATLGIFGVVGMLFTVVSLLGNIEQAMNVIWQTDSGRPLGRKVMDYLALMILLPVAVNVGLGAMTALQSEAVLQKVHLIFPLPWAVPLLINLFTLSVIVATFVILYRFLPNMRVPFFPALAGGFLGGLGWLLVQGLYIKLQIGVAKYNAIYGSFATLPLFLIWIYVGWMVFLCGAEVSFATYVWRRYRPFSDTFSPVQQLSMAYDVLEAVFEDFRQRHLSNPEGLAERLGLPPAPVAKVLDLLKDKGLLRYSEGKEEGYFPSTEARSMKAAEVLEAILGSDTPNTKGGRITEELLEEARRRFGAKTLAELLGN